MAEVKKRDLVEPDSILDEENEATLAAIDRGIKADEGRVVSVEEARRRLREWLTRSFLLCRSETCPTRKTLFAGLLLIAQIKPQPLHHFLSGLAQLPRS
jgi:hypothetical protein